ncbi:TPA: hypothetical protein ACXDAY_002076 [Clostridium botulinum]|uniref:hypothetical protein n=2 Tax=Clostridium botulinum TaxID=1491 RepID=UPI00046713E5|nr:hypothetical protein [Clostridium botulinum]APR02441.1 hypothetical protein RSJ2_4113 [Clostridium botulinum]AUN01620.1 hypothetical protein RSJ19_01185 [Clostridium botulinum]MBN3351950.1 hypothetical protein [Clostridium botulinum]MBN3359341.1 hypothetical protein [Clostridium botulinum]MBN3367170.1 hypothetical protein [Clostridium botulinum]
MSKYTGNNNLNDIFYEIVTILLADEPDEAIDLKKLLYYQNEKDKEGNLIYVNPYAKDIVYEDLCNQNIYQTDYIFDIQKETRNIINVHFAGLGFDSYNDYVEVDYFMIDIYVHKDMEAIEVDGKRIARSVEILNKVRKLLDGKKMQKGVTCLKLRGVSGGKIQDTYIKLTCDFKIKNIR